MTDTETSPPRQSAVLPVLGAIMLCFAVIASCAAYFLWPRGDRLGAIDLRGDPATLSVDVGAGDKLGFRIDTITIGTKNGYPDSSRSRTNKVQDELKASIITLTAVGADGVSKLSTECGAFAGKATTGSSDADSVTSTGLPLDCSLDVERAGAYTLAAKVAWVPKDVRDAVLEVRRQKAK